MGGTSGSGGIDCSNVGCGAPPLCSEGCQATCGCCACGEGEQITVDGGILVCTGGCYAEVPGGPNSGDCTTSAECNGGTCVELTPGGYRVCVNPVSEATACQNPQNEFDECCKSSDCASGKCYAFPATPYCGGAQPIEHNVCASNGCEEGVACTLDGGGAGACMPAGAFGYKVASCISVGCLKDTDCTKESGGRCALIDNPCCGSPIGLFCTYPSNACAKQSDCPDGQHCGVSADPSTGEDVAQCEPGLVPCPA